MSVSSSDSSVWMGGGSDDGRGGGGEDVDELVNEPGPFFSADLGIAPPFLGSDRFDEAVLRPDPRAGCG